MNNTILYILLSSIVLSGCGSSPAPINNESAKSQTFKPIETVCNISDLYGNYNVDFDYDSFIQGNNCEYSIEAKFFSGEVYDFTMWDLIKPGDQIEYNDSNNTMIVQAIERVEKPIAGTELNYETTLINKEYELYQGSNFCSIRPKDSSILYYRSTGEIKRLFFADDFVFYTGFTEDYAIYNVPEAIEYLKSHKELDHNNTDVAFDNDQILAIRYLGASSQNKAN